MICKICGEPSRSEYCFRHKPRKAIAKTPLKKKAYTPKRSPIKKKYYKKRDKPLSLFEQAKKDMWDAYSKAVRLRAADDRGHVKCYTCDHVGHYKEFDAGHFRSRRFMPTFVHDFNCKPQCRSCNRKDEGNHYVFGQNLNNEHGEGTAEMLVRLSLTSKKYTIPEMKKLTEQFLKEISKLKKEKHLK